MLARIGLLFLALVFLASIAMQYLVQSHIEGVAVVHGQEKALHNVDMIETLSDIGSLFDQNGRSQSVQDQIAQMAHDKDNIETVYYDLSGQRIPASANRSDLTNHIGSTNLDAPIANTHTDHSHHAGMSESAPMPHADQGAHHTDHGNHAVADLTIPAPPEMLGRDLLGDGPVFEYGSVTDGADATLPLVTAVVPVHNGMGVQLGYVRFQIDVSSVMAAYSSGLSWFAVVLVAFGAAIFSIPAIGYMFQKRVADRSKTNVKYLANFDSLTGLLNRRGFMARTEVAFETQDLANIAYLDADHFKDINDTYGHAAGDAYLQHISSAIKELFGDGAHTSRLGGDEFVIADATRTHTEFVGLLEQLRETCAAEVILNGITITSTVSVGNASFEGGRSMELALTDADAALYFAKAAGGNGVFVYNDTMAANLARRRALEVLLRRALHDNKFFIHYQPLIDSKTQEVSGYEALLRLTDADGNEISPDEFIPLSESMGLIDEIGTWVIYTATQQIADFNSHDTVAINLSSEQFKSGRLVEIVKDALSQANLPPERLEVEITESLLLGDSTKVAAQIDALKDMGVSVAMDDFGTGFSSLSYLWKFGFDRIKIDRSFISALETDPERSLSLVESIVILGKKLNMEITAEGIETKMQSELLSSLGCDVLQGFYFGRPELLSLPENTQQEGLSWSKTG